MNVVMIGAVAGGVSGAIGYFLAGKVHGTEKGNQIYPLYSVVLFGMVVTASKLLMPL